jgi:hypothetical protein
VWRGVDYGKPKPTDPKDRFVATDKPLWDSVRREWVTPPESAGGGGESSTRGGSKRSPYNLQTAQSEARKVLGDRIGMKFDRDGMPVVERDKKGNPINDASVRWSRLSAITDSMLSKYEDTVGGGEVANAVADAFDEAPTLQDHVDEIMKDDERKVFVVNGTSQKETKAQQIERVNKEARDALQADHAERARRADEALAAASAQTMQNRRDRGMPPSSTQNPPAQPAASAPGAAPARAHGASAADVLTPDTVKGDKDAIAKFKASPMLWTQLTKRGPSGKPQGVIFPDGTMYYLVGNEVRSYKPSTE